MTTTYECPGCQKKLHVVSNGAGKKVKCPGCGTVFSLAATASVQSPPLQQGRKAKDAAPAPPKASPGVAAPKVAAQNCPSCQAPLVASAALCVSCGLDLRTGKKIHRPLSLEPTKTAPVALIAAATAGGLVVVAVGALIVTWVLSGKTKPVQVAAQDSANASRPAAGDANTKSPRAAIKPEVGLGSTLPRAPQDAKLANGSPKMSDVVEEFAPANLTKLIGRKVRWTGTTLGAVAGGEQDLMLVIRPGFMANIRLRQASTPVLAAQSSVTFEGTYEGVVGNIGGFSAGGNQTGGAEILGINDAIVVATKDAAPSQEKNLTAIPVQGNPVEEPTAKLPTAVEGAADADKAPAAVGGFMGRSKQKPRPRE